MRHRRARLVLVVANPVLQKVPPQRRLSTAAVLQRLDPVRARLAGRRLWPGASDEPRLLWRASTQDREAGGDNRARSAQVRPARDDITDTLFARTCPRPALLAARPRGKAAICCHSSVISCRQRRAKGPFCRGLQALAGKENVTLAWKGFPCLPFPAGSWRKQHLTSRNSITKWPEIVNEPTCSPFDSGRSGRQG